MKKNLFCVFLLLCCILTCFSQNVQNLEGEASMGLTVPFNNFHKGEKSVGPDLGLELRYNLPQTPWDCGLNLNITTAVYKYYDAPKSDWYWEQSNRSVSLMIVGDYNFKQGLKINPFFGVGLGLSLYDSINEVVYESSGSSVLLRPRFGIELFRHLRIGIFSTITRVGYSNCGISIGGVIGGLPKKNSSYIFQY